MTQWGFLIDQRLCVGCKACEVACKTRNKLESPGPRIRRVRASEEGTFPDTRIINMSLSCMHCAKPACVESCPAGALTKSEEDGVVRCDVTKCIGCKMCSQVCPFDAPSYRSDNTHAKCDLCTDRRVMGLKPACVTTCFNHALTAGTMEELEALAAGRTRRSLSPDIEVSVIIVD